MIGRCQPFEPGHEVAQPTQRLGQHRVVRCAVEVCVKFHVLQLDLTRLHKRLKFCDDVLELRDLFIRDSLGGQLARDGDHVIANLERVSEGLMRDLRDIDTLLWNDANQSIRFKPNQRLADWGSADSELLREPTLLQRTSWRNVADEDLVQKLAVHVADRHENPFAH